MELRAELLKSIWYGFTALDLEKSGKVSKSQLKVNSFRLIGQVKIVCGLILQFPILYSGTCCKEDGCCIHSDLFQHIVIYTAYYCQ